jgi:hypothetical protein
VSYVSEILADSPVAYWRLGETSGTTAVDSSGSGHSGTYGGTLTLAQTGVLAGDADKSVLFGGGTVDLGTAAYLDFSGNFTWEGWIKTTSTAVSAVFGAYDPANPFAGWGIGVNIAANALGCFLGPDVLGAWESGTLNVCDGNWHQNAVTINGTVGTLYCDGAVDRTFTAKAHSGSGVNKRIGAAGVDVSFPYSGLLDEVSVFSAALSTARILAHYNAGMAAGFDRRKSSMLMAHR